MKKLLAIVLCLLLLTTAVPMSVFAYENNSNVETVVGSFDLLGRGFNALSDAAINEMEISGQESIFNNNVQSTLLATSYTTAGARYAKSAQELMSSFGIEFGNEINISIPIYTAKVGFENKFSSSSSVTDKSVNESIYFYYYQETVTNRYSLKKHSLGGQLSESFLADLDALVKDSSTANIDEFFSVWGTHILTSYDKGGFLEYAASAHSTSTKCTENGKVSETIGASVGVGDASVGTTFTVAQTMASEFGTSDYILDHSWNCCGGQSNLVGTKTGTDDTVIIEADAWKTSISHENAVLLPQSTQWKAIWNFIPVDDKYVELIGVLEQHYIEKAVGVNAEFFAKYTTDFHVKNADKVYYISPSMDATGNNLIYEMDVADSYVVDPKSKINIVDVGTDLSNMYIDINPAGLAAVDLDTGYVTFSDRLKDGDEVTIRIKGLLPDGTPGDNVRAQGTYKIKQEGTTADGIQLFAGGYGDATRPYLIVNATQFSNIRNANALANHFALIQDINVGNFEPLPSFAGTFDGNGYTLSGGRYTQSTNGKIGLFREIANGGIVKNVTLKDFYIDSTNKGKISGRVYVGLLCGENKGTIENVVIDSGRIDTQMGSLSMESDNYLQVGLLCGRSDGVIRRCGVYTTVGKSEVKAICEVGIGGDEENDLAEVCVGAIVGYVHDDGKVSDVYAHDCTIIGGAHSTTYRNIFNKCWNHGRPSVYAGGVAGCIGGTASLERALAYDNDLSECYCIIDNHDCDWKGEIKYVGTLVGLQEGDSGYKNCYGETGEGWFVGSNSNTSGNTNKLASLKTEGIISNLNGYAAEWYQPDGAGHIRIAQNIAVVINDNYIDTEYFVGESLNMVDIEIKPIKEGFVAPLTMSLNGFTITGYDPNVVGEQTLTVTCGKLSGTYTVTVKEPEPVALFVLTMPDQVLFQEGDTIDYTGLTAIALLDNGETMEVEQSDLQFAVEDADVETKKVIVSYEGCCAEFMIQVVAVPELPENAPAFAVDDATVCAGEEFTVAIRTQRNSGIVSLKFEVEYDADVLVLVSAQEQDFANMTFSPITNNPFVASWVDAIHPNNTTDGVVVLLTFRVKEEAPVGETEIALSYDPEDVYDQNFDNVAFRVDNGVVAIMDYVPGDVNGDGRINNKDLGVLQQYLADWDVSLNTRAADVTGDGRVNNKDLGRLQQYLADWDVELG